MYRVLLSMLKNRKGGISTVVATLLLLGAVIAASTYLASFVSGFMNLKQTPNLQLVIQDYPDSLDSGFSFVIRHIGGDAVRFEDIMVVICDSSGDMVYSGTLNSEDFLANQVSIRGYNSTFFEVGEQVLAKREVVGSEGVYEISVYYIPSNSMIYTKRVFLS